MINVDAVTDRYNKRGGSIPQTHQGALQQQVHQVLFDCKDTRYTLKVCTVLNILWCYMYC